MLSHIQTTYSLFEITSLELIVRVIWVLLHSVISQVYTQKLVRSDKYKTGKDNKYVEKKVIFEDNRDILIGRIPVMVKSELCWMNGVERGDCEYDHGGYFLIKGAEKVSIQF